jgi:tRNA1Val (adenine37-N6)-methyltransferase
LKDNFSDPQFKGWTKPGPVILPPSDFKIEPGETLDAISGYFRLFQLKKGHRFSTDDVLTAWYGTSWCPRAERALDLGSGIGSIGMIAAWRLPGAQFVIIEAQEESVRLARKSARFNRLESRYEIRQGDFRDPAMFRADEKFDLVFGSPPYFPLGTGVKGDHPQKVACRFEVRGDIRDYCEAAARALAPGGWFACVFPTEQLERIQRAAEDAKLTIVRRRPIVLREGEPPLLNVFAMVAQTDLPGSVRDKTWVEPSLIVRASDGSVHPEYSAVKLSIGFPP